MADPGGVRINFDLLPTFGSARPKERDLLGAGMTLAGAGLKYGVPYTGKKIFAGTVSPADEQYYSEGMQRAAAKAEQQAPGGAMGISDVRSIGDVGTLIKENLLYSLPQMGAAVAGGVTGGLAGGPRGAFAGAVGANTPFFVGSNVQRATESGTQPLTQEAAMRSAAVAPLQAASDVLVGRYIPFVGKAFGVKRATQEGSKWLTRTVKSVTKAGATEAVTETGQQAAERFAAGLVLTDRDAASEYVNAFGTAFFVGGALGSLGGFRKNPVQTADPAQINDDTLRDVVDQVVGPPAVSPGEEQQIEMPLEPPVTAFPEGHQPDLFNNTYEQLEAVKRPLKDVPTEDLLTAVNASASGTTVDPEIVDAVQLELDQRSGAAAQNSAAPASTNTDPLADVKRTPRWFKDAFVAAESDEARLELIHDAVIVNANNGGKWREELGKKFGLLDEDGKPTELETQISARKAPAVSRETPESAAPTSLEGGDASVDPEFPKTWKELLKGPRGGAMRSDAIVELRKNPPKNLDEAEVRVYNALGGQGPADTTLGNRRLPVGGVEEVAFRMDILDEHGILTPHGEEVARKALTFEEAAQAAIDHGFKGQAAVMFERGARAPKDAPTPKFKNFQDLAAYQAGKAWVVPKGVTKPLPASVLNEEVTPEQQALGSPLVVKTVGTPDAQERMQEFNKTIDALALNPAIRPAEVAQLKTMVAEDWPAEDIQQAIEHVQDGGTIEVETDPRAPYTGEKPTRGLVRGMPVRNAPVRSNKVENTKMNERLIAAYEGRKDLLRQEIDAARTSEDITPKEQIGLIHRLINNDLQGVVDRLPGGRFHGDPQLKTSRREFLAGAAAVAAVGLPSPSRASLTRTNAAEALRHQLAQDNIPAALQHVKNHSVNNHYRLIASKLLRGDWSNVSVVVVDSEHPQYEGRTRLNDDGSTSIELYGEGGKAEETILHELIHAYVQQRWAGLKRYLPSNKELVNDTTDRADAVVARFQEIWKRISDALMKTHPELFDLDDLQRDGIWPLASMVNPDEMLSWTLTNADAQAFLRSVDSDGNKIAADGKQSKSLWDIIVDFFAGLLGLPTSNKKARSALDEIMSAGYAVLDAGAGVKTGDFNVKLARARAEEQASMVKGPPRTPADIDARVKEAIGEASKTLQGAMSNEGRLRKTVLGFASENDIHKVWGSWFDFNSENGLRLRDEAYGFEQAVSARMHQMITDSVDAYNALMYSSKESAKNINQLMQASGLGLDPTKKWRDQRESIRYGTNAKRLEATHADLHKMYNKLVANGHVQVYNNLRTTNDVLMLSQLAVSLHAQVQTDTLTRSNLPGLPAFLADPMEKFMDVQARKHMSLMDIRDFWDRELADRMRELKTYLEVNKITAKDAKEYGVTAHHLATRLTNMEHAVRLLKDVPYFHLGRHGNYFTGWTVRDETALAAVADHLREAGFEGVISKASDRLNVYMRLENQQQQQTLLDELNKLKQYIEPKSITAGEVSQSKIRHGYAEQWVSRMLQDIDTLEDVSDEEKSRLKQTIHATSLNLMPENSLALVMTHRDGVPGFSPDMMRNFAKRAKIGIDALAGLSTAPKITQSFVQMRAAIKHAQHNPDAVPINQVNGMQNIVDELSRRDREMAAWPQTPGLDQLSAFSTAHFLGWNVAYPAVNLTGLGVLVLPELGSKFGFVRSAKAIGDSTGMALKIMRQVFAQGYKVSAARATDAVVTRKVLDNAGVPAEMAEYLMSVINSGNIDIGGPSRETARAATGSGDGKVDKYLRYATALGYYSETLSRLITAIAYRKLNPKADVKSAAAEAAAVIDDTQWDYNPRNQGRQFGKMGMFGRITPLTTKFMQYTAQLLGKLYREIYDAIKGETPADRAEARKFLAGHVAAITVLTGSLGLPFATVFAALFDKLSDMFGDDEEPTNIRAAYRNWLVSVFGEEMGEILARGAPRAIGVDVSQRAGEQDIIPFSRFFADRRRFMDKIKDVQSRAWGAPSSMIFGFLEGGEKISEGDVMGGLARMLPIGWAAPVKAWRLNSEGAYIDGSGNELPMTPGARDILWQAMGFNPADAAQNTEARGDQNARKSLLGRRATVLRNKIADSIIAGDEETTRELIKEALEFEADTTGFSVLEGVEANIARRVRLKAIAQATGTPRGVSTKDRHAQELTSYAAGTYH